MSTERHLYAKLEDIPCSLTLTSTAFEEIITKSRHTAAYRAHIQRSVLLSFCFHSSIRRFDDFPPAFISRKKKRREETEYDVITDL